MSLETARNSTVEPALLVSEGPLRLSYGHLRHSRTALPRTEAYVFVPPGGAIANGNTTALFQAGGGLEEVLRQGIGFGVEAGALRLSHNFGQSVAGELSPNIFYHSDIHNLLNVGTGFNDWFRPHPGVRIAVRDQIAPSDSVLNGHVRGDSTQYWGVRLEDLYSD